MSTEANRLLCKPVVTASHMLFGRHIEFVLPWNAFKDPLKLEDKQRRNFIAFPADEMVPLRFVRFSKKKNLWA